MIIIVANLLNGGKAKMWIMLKIIVLPLYITALLLEQLGYTILEILEYFDLDW